jgi:hypothetical protein
MAVDAFTLSALAVVVLIAALVVYVVQRMRAETRDRLSALEDHLQAHARASLNRPGRELCGAVHRLHPNARLGLDFEIADQGQGPYIKQWLLPVPQPGEPKLREALAAYRAEQAHQAYREVRLAEYPSIGDQLDALYKARHGDSAELQAIDNRIADVKAAHPKPGEC